MNKRCSRVAADSRSEAATEGSNVKVKILTHKKENPAEAGFCRLAESYVSLLLL